MFNLAYSIIMQRCHIIAGEIDAIEEMTLRDDKYRKSDLVAKCMLYDEIQSLKTYYIFLQTAFSEIVGPKKSGENILFLHPFAKIHGRVRGLNFSNLPFATLDHEEIEKCMEKIKENTWGDLYKWQYQMPLVEEITFRMVLLEFILSLLNIVKKHINMLPILSEMKFKNPYCYPGIYQDECNAMSHIMIAIRDISYINYGDISIEKRNSEYGLNDELVEAWERTNNILSPPSPSDTLEEYVTKMLKQI